MPYTPDTVPTTLSEHLRAFLATHGLARVPAQAGAAPPMWLDPRRGAPAPGETMGADVERDNDLVISAYRSPGIVPRPRESWLRVDNINLRIRARVAPVALDWHNRVRAILHDAQNYELAAGVVVVESRLFRDLSLIAADEQGYDYATEYTFELADQPRV